MEKRDRYERSRDSVYILSVQPRNVQMWTPDDAVSECHRCHVEFGWVTRRHHCRACGRIFCFQCGTRYAHLPRDIVRYPTALQSSSPSVDDQQRKDGKERLCESCYRYLKRTRTIYDYVRIFDRMGLDVVQLRTQIALVSRLWCAAAMQSLSTFREIQYRLPWQSLSERETRMLRINAHILRNAHSAWLVPLLQAGALDKSETETEHRDDEKARKRESCRMLMCTRYCQHAVSEHDAVFMLMRDKDGAPDSMLEQCTNALEESSNLWLPHITYSVRFGGRKQADAIVQMLLRRKTSKNNRISDKRQKQVGRDNGNNNNSRDGYNHDCKSSLHTDEDDSGDDETQSFENSILAELDLCLQCSSGTDSQDQEQSELSDEGDADEGESAEHTESQTDYQSAEESETFWLLRLWLEEAKRQRTPAIVSIYERALAQYAASETLETSAALVHLMMCDDRRGVRSIMTEAIDKCNASPRSKGIPLPVIGPNRVCVAIDTDACEVKHSATRPTTYPCTLDDGSDFKLLVKREDVRSDLIVINAIRYMVDVLKSEENLDLGVVTYNVMPVSATGGLIEMVRDASTLYDVRHRLRKSVFKHIVESNDQESVRQVRARFVRSTAAYCVITYLLGVGDRHLENIMVTRDGRLFHIDYGFVLGDDPKPMAAPVMRISPDMVEAIGDVGSEPYAEFEALCTNIYNALRRHVRPIAIMLSLLVRMDVVSEEKLDRELLQRFVPGENAVQAQLQLSKKIEGSRTSYTQSAIDISHHQSRVVSQASDIVARPLRKAFTSFESWWWSSTMPVPGSSPP